MGTASRHLRLFTLPLGKLNGDYGLREKRSSSFLGGISRLEGLVGLDGPMHNPNRELQGKLLLRNEGRRNGY
jgi:hypothetical protein